MKKLATKIANSKRRPRPTPLSEVPPPPAAALMWTINEAAAAMRCSRPTCYQRVRVGAIAGYRVGELIRIDPESVKTFLRSRPIAPTAGRKLAG